MASDGKEVSTFTRQLNKYSFTEKQELGECVEKFKQQYEAEFDEIIHVSSSGGSRLGI